MDVKPNRQFERQCAVELVNLLVAHHRLPLRVVAVFVADNWKTLFTFDPYHLAKKWEFNSKRYGRGVGLEVDWQKRYGDVDAYQWDGDLWTAFQHFGQILGKWFTGKETRPSKLLKRAQKETAPAAEATEAA